MERNGKKFGTIHVMSFKFFLGKIAFKLILVCSPFEKIAWYLPFHVYRKIWCRRKGTQF